MFRTYKKYLALLLTCVLMFSMSIQVSASNNGDSISEIMENEIEASTILDEDDYTVCEITADEIPENVVPLQFDTIEEAMAYLEEYEMTAPLVQRF